MGFTKPIEQILLSYQGTFIVSKRYYTRYYTRETGYDKDLWNANLSLL